MKKTAKVVLSSAVSMALCASLIAGSTFALFTSESKTNIAITSGKVAVESTAKITKVTSAKWEADSYTDEDLYPDGYEDESKTYEFTNGGTASYADGMLMLYKVSPGDGVEFTITSVNNSTIAIKYRTVVTFVNGGDPKEDGTANDTNGDVSLFRALDITVKDEEGMTDISTDRSTASSDWSEKVEAGDPIDDINVSIKFPMGGDEQNKLQNKSCKIAIGVYAVQSNGNDTSHDAVYFVNNDSALDEVFGDAEDGDTIVLSGNVANEKGGLAIGDAENPKDVSIDLSGNEFGVSKESDASEDLVIAEGSSLTVKDSTSDGNSKFTVNTNKNSNNAPQEGGDREPITDNTTDKKYTMKVEGELNFEDVDVEVNNKQGDIGVCVDGGKVNFDENTELSINGRDKNDGYGETGFGKGFYVTNGGTINLNNATVESEGAVTSFIVGGGDKESTLNVKGGTYNFKNMYNSITHSTFVSAFQTYKNGTINISDNADLSLTGGAVNQLAYNGDERDTGYTNMVLISTIGGGNVNVTNSTLTVAPELGNAIVVQTACSYYYQAGHVDAAAEQTCDYQYHKGVQNNSHVTIGEGTKIYLNNAAHDSTSGGEVCYAFAASRNGKQITQYSTDGVKYQDETTSKEPIHAVEENSDNGTSYTIKVVASAKIYVNYIEGTKENPGDYYEMTNKENGTDSQGKQHTVYIYDLGLPKFINRYDPTGILFE